MHFLCNFAKLWALLSHVSPPHYAHKLWCVCHFPWNASPASLKSCLINPCSKLGVSETELFNPIMAHPHQSPSPHGTCDYLHLSTFKSLICTWPRSQCQCKSDGQINFIPPTGCLTGFDARHFGSSHPVLIRSFCVLIKRINRKPHRNWCLHRDS